MSESIKTIGRPPALTDDVVKKIVEVLKTDGTISDACDYAEISRPTFYKYLKEDEQFSNKIAKAKQYVKLRAKKNISHDIITGSVNTAKWYLEHRFPKEYSKSPDVALQVNQQFTVDFIDPETDEIMD